MGVEENKYIVDLKNIILNFLKDENVKVILLGSRARLNNYNNSDIDICIVPYNDFNQNKITLLREKLEDLSIPYKVEIINFNEVSEDFKREILKEHIIWKD
ncbi:MAG: nucleotidyltransferase domain-containing protein [Candidatus Hydrogenedentota bacterium]